MDMEMVGWFAIGWFAVALVVSLALGALLSQVNAGPGEDDLASAMAKRKGMRFMRSSIRSVAVRGHKDPLTETSKRRESKSN